jgi:hypothetical protein
VPVLVGVQWKKEKNKLAKFNYKKWVTENRYGKQPHLFEKEEEEKEEEEKDDTKDDTKDDKPKDDKPKSADWWCTGTGTAGPSCMQSSTQPSGTTGGPYPDQTTCQTACTTPPTGSGCDNSPNSQCAQTWFGLFCQRV